ncbi:tail protein X [Burkholderia savannae]|nr:tail protein X [Burkholderia savannae]
MFLTHITVESERWDQIAYRYYGDPLAYERIIAANPDVPITPQLPSGIALSIPVVSDNEVTEDLPPWMR